MPCGEEENSARLRGACFPESKSHFIHGTVFELSSLFLSAFGFVTCLAGLFGKLPVEQQQDRVGFSLPSPPLAFARHP